VRERRQPQVRDLVAHESPCDTDRVHSVVRDPLVAEAVARGIEEAHVEAHVVADDRGVGARRPDELEERGEHLVDHRRRSDERVRQTGRARRT
jgi:hypothetical protein